MKQIKEYYIPDDGDCLACECNRECEMSLHECIAFDEMLQFRATKPIQQCQACKDWLKQQKE